MLKPRRLASAVVLLGTGLVGVDLAFGQAAAPLNFRDASAKRILAFPQDPGPHMKEVAIGDFDRDGDPDAAMAVSQGTIGARRNKLFRNDAGILVEVSGAAIIPEFANADVSRHAAFRDVDADGWLDLILVNDGFEYADPIMLFMNQHPGGAFTHFLESASQRGLPAAWSCGGVSVDLDHDGDIDIYSGNYGSQGQDSMYLNNGAGFFSPGTNRRVPPETQFTIDVASADMNGDGRVDLLISNKSDDYWIYYNNLNGAGDDGNGDFRYGAGGAGGKQLLGVAVEGALEPVDMNGDGRVDIYWTNRHGATEDMILQNTGNGPDGRAQFVEVAPPEYPRSVHSTKATVADLNRDNRPDLIVMSVARPAILRNTSVGGVISFVDWTPAPAFPFGPALGGAHAEPLDIDSDNDLDLLIGGDARDFALESIATPQYSAAELNGVLPVFVNLDPILVRGRAPSATTDSYQAGSLGTTGHLSIVVSGAGDYRVEALRNGGVEASSNRGGLGVEEALETAIRPGEWTLRVVTLDAGPGSGAYSLELLARQDNLNDQCPDAIHAALGENEFTNVGASTDGPAHPLCNSFGNSQVPADVWFDFRATCTGMLTVSTCGGANFDTKLAVYAGTECPVTDGRLLACVEDTPDCPNFTSEVQVGTNCGDWYKIRVGGYLGAQGSGALLLEYQSECAAGCVGDVNCDGFVTVSDIGAFVLAITDPTAYAAAYPLCDIASADINGDGFAGVGDIGAFVQLLVGG